MISTPFLVSTGAKTFDIKHVLLFGYGFQQCGGWLNWFSMRLGFFLGQCFSSTSGRYEGRNESKSSRKSETLTPFEIQNSICI